MISYTLPENYKEFFSVKYLTSEVVLNNFRGINSWKVLHIYRNGLLNEKLTEFYDLWN